MKSCQASVTVVCTSFDKTKVRIVSVGRNYIHMKPCNQVEQDNIIFTIHAKPDTFELHCPSLVCKPRKLQTVSLSERARDVAWVANQNSFTLVGMPPEATPLRMAFCQTR